MEDFRLDQSGQEVQEILNGAAMQSDLTAETERATEAEQTLQGNIDAEETRAQGAEGTLQDNIDVEETRAKAAEKQNADDIDAIEEKIPSGASSSNKLTTEEYVADAVATATATFRGTYNLVSDLHLNVNATEQQIAAALAGAISTADNNDYCFILVPTSSETPTEIKEIDRYKFNGTAWGFEYKLNNSGFTAAQWAAINSGITSGDVAKLAALPTNAQLTTLLAGLQSDIDGEEARAKAAELAIQGNIDAEETRAKAAEKQNADDIDAIEDVLPETASSENKVATESEINSLSASIEAILLLIPSAATSLNKLADKAFVNSSIATATATFRGTYNLVNDLGLTTSATHAQIATALAGAILTADNNDYAFVQIPTSDAMPTEIAKTERYKFNGTAWEYEYDLNNSGFTADQWAAINSGITQALVTKLAALPTNAELTTELGTLTSGITTINQKIPSAASQANKLVDTAAMESYIVQVLDVLTISYNVTSTDGHVTLSIEQVDGKITSVTLTTSDIASADALNLKASQADLTALASRVTTAEGNITTLGGRMTTAEGNITSLGGRMTTAEGNITSLGGRVSTNETDIANLQQLYNDLQQSKPVPVTALPSTGQQQGVIYRLAGITSYSDYMWNGSTWVLMATYNNAVDPRPKKASLNLVTSGGVFDNMGALDVSELNATENPHTLAQYVDLSAALAAIPTDYQKGGMSIKFVRSSDNKYVQARLMAQNFTTDVTQWQVVDDEPTAGSDNLVKSGGIYDKIVDGDKKSIIYSGAGISYNATSITMGKLFRTGTVNDYETVSGSFAQLFDVVAGNKYYVLSTVKVGSHFEEYPLVIYLDSSNNVIGSVFPPTSSDALPYVIRELSVPSGAAHLIVNSRFMNLRPVLYNSLLINGDWVVLGAQVIENKMYSNKGERNVTGGKYIKVQVKSGLNYRITTSSYHIYNSNYPVVEYLDKEGTIISGEYIAPANKRLTIEQMPLHIPVNAEYATINWRGMIEGETTEFPVLKVECETSDGILLDANRNFNGIESKLSTILGDIVESIETTYNSCYKSSTDAFDTNVSSCITQKYEVLGNTKYIVSSVLKIGQSGYYIGLVQDENGNTLEYFGEGTSDGNEFFNQEVTMPAGAKYLFLTSRANSDYPILTKAKKNGYIPEIKNKQKEISVLWIGNSLLQDAVSYLPFLMKKILPEVSFKFYMYINYGRTLTEQYEDYINANAYCNQFSIAENNEKWNNSVQTTMANLLNNYKFDIVVMEEYFSHKTEYTQEDLQSFNDIIAYIEEHYSLPFRVATFVHAPIRNNIEDVYALTINSNKTILKETAAQDILVPGIAIYKAFDTSLDSLGDSGHLSVDGVHAQEGLPCLIQAYTIFLWICDKFGVPKSVLGNKNIITSSNYADIDVPGAHLGTGVVAGTDADNKLAQEVAVSAYKKGQSIMNDVLAEL